MAPEIENVWPADMADPDFAARLADEFGDLLVLFHPFYRCWQVYCAERRVDWTAERLAQAIIANHEAFGRQGWEATFWWQWRGSPYIVEDDLPRPPGDWLLAWLRRADCPPEVFLRRFERERLQQRARARRHRHDVHRAITGEAYRHIRDHMDGDPLAGKRRWVMPVTKDLKGEKNRVGADAGHAG